MQFLFPIYLPMKKDEAIHFKSVKPLSPKEICAKFVRIIVANKKQDSLPQVVAI